MATDIHFVRLTQIAPAEIIAHMSDPRIGDHMPLLAPIWTEETVAQFVNAKEDSWVRDGLGYQAILADGEYVGWGGLQKDNGEWDFGLVLRPDRFGLGAQITKMIINQAKADERVDSIIMLLPPSRKNLGALKRMGAEFLGDIIQDGERFLKYRLRTP